MQEPKFVPVVAQVDKLEESNVTLICIVESGDLSDINYRWYKDGKQIFSSNPNNDVKYKIEKSLGSSEYVSLKIFKLSANDSGSYTCDAKNKYGTDTKTTKLNVKRKLKI